MKYMWDSSSDILWDLAMPHYVCQVWQEYAGLSYGGRKFGWIEQRFPQSEPLVTGICKQIINPKFNLSKRCFLNLAFVIISP